MTIRHIVLWKLSADDADTRAVHAEEMARRLVGLKDAVAEIQQIDVKSNVAYPDKNWHVALVADFADLDALERYQVSPEHVAVAEFVRSVVSERAAVDYPL